MSVDGYKSVDTRFLKSGKIRLRFKLSEEAFNIVDKAMGMTGFKYPSSSIDAICINFLAEFPSSLTLDFPAHGRKRFLVRLHADEYETVRRALKAARQYVGSDEEALVLICESFLAVEMNMKKFSDNSRDTTANVGI